MVLLPKKVAEILKYFKGIEIARRYFIINSFDATIVALSIFLIAFLSGNFPKEVVIKSVLAASIGAALSGFFGAYSSEVSERTAEIKKLEKALGRSLKKSIFEKYKKIFSLFVATVDSLPPVMLALICLLPLLIIKNYNLGLKISITISFLSITFLGYLLGRIAEENVITSSLRFLGIGIVLTIVLIFIDYLL